MPRAKFPTIFSIGILLSLLIVLLSAQRILNEIVDADPMTRSETYYVQQSKVNFYFYQVFTENGVITVSILDQNLMTHNLTFQKENHLIFRDAYNRFIIVEETDTEDRSIACWMLQIVHKDSDYVLDSFEVNSIVNNEGAEVGDSFRYIKIREYDIETQRLYVYLQTAEKFTVYEIDVGAKADQLMVINWFYFTPEADDNIIGGNSGVLVEGRSNQFWIDTKNERTDQKDPSVYQKVDVRDLTTLPINDGVTPFVYNFLGSYFQYVSISEDQLSMSTFFYHGYEKIKAEEEGSITSQLKPIKIYSDQQTYFLAVSDSDLYFSVVRWNQQSLTYELYSGGLQDLQLEQLDIEQRQIRQQRLYNALLLVYNTQDASFYVLNQGFFNVYGPAGSYEKVFDENVDESSDLEYILTANIKAYKEQNAN